MYFCQGGGNFSGSDGAVLAPGKLLAKFFLSADRTEAMDAPVPRRFDIDGNALGQDCGGLMEPVLRSTAIFLRVDAQGDAIDHNPYSLCQPIGSQKDVQGRIDLVFLFPLSGVV